MYTLTTTIINTKTSAFKCELMPVNFETKEEAEDYITYNKMYYDIKSYENCITYYIKEGNLTYINKLWLKTIEY